MATGTYGPGKLVERLPVATGAVVGVAAHFAGLVATALLLVADPEFEFGTSRVVRVGTVDEIGWVFFSAHFARIERTVPFGSGGGGTERLNILAETALAFPAAIFYAVPVVLLVAGGAVVAGRDLWESSLKAHAFAGGTVVAGYFPLAAMGVFLFETEFRVEDEALANATFSQGPELATTVLLVGLVFPLLFGAIGGLLASRLR